MRKILALAVILFLLDGSAYAGNVSQTGVNRVDKSVTLASGAWTLVAAADVGRQAMQCQAISSHNMGLYINDIANGSTAPVPSGIGSAGVLTLFPGGAYEPQGGFIFTGAVWVIGTSGDAITCWFGPTQP